MVNDSFGELLDNNQSSVPDFDGLIPCYRWYVQNKTVPYEQAHEACSVYDFVDMGTGIDIIFWLTGIFIITTNLMVLLGMIATRKRLKPICFFLANLAMSDLLSGIALLYRTEGHVFHSVKYGFMMTFVDLMAFTQMISASALSILSVSSCLAVTNPIFFRTHAGNIKRITYSAMGFSWIGFSLLGFSPSMGWNCLDMQTLITGKCIKYYPMAFFIITISIMFVLGSVMLFTNIIVYIVIKRRKKNRPQQSNTPTPQMSKRNDLRHNSKGVDQETSKKLEESEQRAKTIILHIVVVFTFWLITFMIIPICNAYRDMCPRMNVLVAAVCLSSAFNPITTVVRTPPLRRTLRQKLTDVHRMFATVMRENPQDEHLELGNVARLQNGATTQAQASHLSEE
ncbi:sphingosine 1-phosphate receptor 1-like [Branchiostoma floridae x Branchiostoma japonicum]